jgi:hypothetical protein
MQPGAVQEHLSCGLESHKTVVGEVDQNGGFVCASTMDRYHTK